MAAHDHRTMSSPHLGLDPLFATSNTGENHYAQQDSPFALSSEYTGQEPWKMDSFPQQGYLGVPTTTDFPPELDQSSTLLNIDCLNELDLLSDPPPLDVKPLMVGSSSSACSMAPVVSMPSAPHSYLSYDPSLGSEVGQIGFIEQQQVKLRQTQQLQQQKLLELQQTILQTQLLKTKLSLASMAVSSSDVSTSPSVAQSHSSTVSSPSNASSSLTTATTTGSITSLQMPPGLKLPLPQQPSSRSTELLPERKTAHNAIERKYRLSINDRINDLRQIITQGDEEMGKKLQKAAVLRKTIDYIRHLENNNRKLLAENRKLRQKMDTSTHSVAQLEQGTVAMVTDMASDPETPPSTLSDASSPASQGEPSPLPEGPAHLPPEYPPLYTRSQGVHGEGPFSGLLSLLNMGDMSRLALCVVMMFTVAFVPGSMFGSAPSALDYSTLHGSARHLSTVDDPAILSISALLLTACLRLFIAWLCVGWLVAQSLPLTVSTTSRRYGTFGKFVQQARSCKQKGNYETAAINYYKALDTVGVTIPSSLVSKMAAVVWQAITFVYLKFLCGLWFVRIARRRTLLRCKESVGPLEVAQAMFECLEASMLHCSSCSLQRWQLALSAMNTAQIFGRVPGEYWLLCALECRLSLPAPFSAPAMRCCLWRAQARLNFLPPIHHWMVSSNGQEFLNSSERSWKAERHTTGKPAGPLGSPLLSVTHAYFEKLLSEAFVEMLFPQPSPSSQDPSFISSVKSFRSILELSKSVFVSGEGLSSESGFEDITWWAAVGTITSTWLSGASDDAVDVYRLMESMPAVLAHNSDPLPTALLFAFRAHTLYYKKEKDASQVLHLVHNASTNLTSSVALPTEECSDDKTRSQLWECGRLLGCDWLLSLRLAMWEQSGREEAVRLTLTRGYQTDVDSLSNLATTRTAILPRVLLHKSCLNVMNGANPMQTQQLLTFIRSAPSVRNRKGQKAVADSEENVSYEQAMAIILAYKHLPGTFRPQEGGCLLQEAAAIFKKLGSHSGLRQCHALAAQ